MNSVFTYLDTAPILDLAYLSIFLLAIAVLIGWAIHTIVTERRYAKKRQRLIELAEASPPRVPVVSNPDTNAAASNDSLNGCRQSPQAFDAEHSYRPRLGLTRRGK